MTEAELQQAVVECAHLFGWKVAHFRPARTSKGWRTPVGADGKGFPDLFMVKPGSSLAPFAVELKQDGKKPSAEQHAWLDALADAGCYVAVWTPKDWVNGTVEGLLRMK